MGDARQTEVRLGAYSLPLPEGWVDRTVATVAGPMEHGVSPNVVVTREELCDHMGLGAFAAGWIARLSEELPVRELRPVEHETVAGVRAQIRTVGWRATGLEIVQLAALLVADDHGYAIVATAAEQSFEALEPVFRQTIDGFRLSRVEVPT